MIFRENLELELPYVFDRKGYGAAVWQVLGSGFLTGKY